MDSRWKGDFEVQPGDRLVRFAGYEGLLRSGVIVSGAIEDAAQLARRGVPVEAAGPGGYVEVIEESFAGGPARRVGRRMVDPWGRVPRGQAVVRGEPPVAPPPAATPAAAPATGDPWFEPPPDEPVGADPGGYPEAAGAGTVVHRRVPVEFFRTKFHEFVNDRKQPLVTVRIHDNVVYITFAKDLADIHHMKPKAIKLGHLEAKQLPLDPDVTIKDLNSTRLAAGAAIVADPRAGNRKSAALTLDVEFETRGTEIEINNFSDVDLEKLAIHVQLELAHAVVNGRGAIGYRPRVRVDVKANLNNLPDFLMGDVGAKMRQKLTEGLANPRVHDEISRALTRWLTGGDFEVRSVDVDQTGHLVIGYVEPPRDEIMTIFPERPQPRLTAGNLSKIDHVVVLMMENRSFDHMLGYLSLHGGRRDVDGLTGKEQNVHNGRVYRPFHLTDTVFEVDPCHGHHCVLSQIGKRGAMDGFVSAFAASVGAGATSPGDVMGYYDAKDLPVYDALAREFVVCDKWFASHPGGTYPNRFYAVAGRLEKNQYGVHQYVNPDMVTYAATRMKTIFDHLSERAVSWHYYEHGYCFLRLFHRYVDDLVNIRPARDFFAAAADGRLPSVAYIDPDFIEYPPANDDHAPADVRDGQRLIGRIVDALMKGPKWDRTLLLITYDEHGGFYDHVRPPPAVDVSAVNEYGVRIPSFVVSPWVDGGTASHTVYDHTSILKTIIRRFCGANPPDLGERVAAAADFGPLLSRRQARRNIPPIAIPPPSANPPRERVTEDLVDAANPESLRSFHNLLRANRRLYAGVRRPAAGTPLAVPGRVVA